MAKLDGAYYALLEHALCCGWAAPAVPPPHAWFPAFAAEHPGAGLVLIRDPPQALLPTPAFSPRAQSDLRGALMYNLPCALRMGQLIQHHASARWSRTHSWITSCRSLRVRVKERLPNVPRAGTGNAAASARLLEEHGQLEHVTKVWGVRPKPGGELRLPRKAAAGNPLLAVLFARFQEGARLLYGLGEARTSLSEIA